MTSSKRSAAARISALSSASRALTNACSARYTRNSGYAVSSLSAAADELPDAEQHDGCDHSGDAVGGVNVRRTFEVTRHEGRQLTGRHDEIHHRGNGANNGQKVSDHFHCSFSPVTAQAAPAVT